MAKIGKYLYGLIRESSQVDLKITGIGPLKRPVELICFKELSAAVSDAPLIEYDPTRELLMGHEKVIENLLKQYTVIPFRFGTIAKSRKDITNLMERCYDELLVLLGKLDNKLEVGLKISWKKDTFNKDIETPEIIRLRDSLMGRPERDIYNEKIELGRLVEAVVEGKREKYSGEILEALRPLSADYKVNDILNVRMIFNGSFLIGKSLEGEFDKVVQCLYDKYKDLMEFKYTGPWAPYNFIDISINLDD